MKNVTKTIEALTKARDGLNMVRDDLLEAARHADPVAWLVIFDQIQPVTQARINVDNLLNALTREEE